MIRAVVHGARGRMGAMILRAIDDDSRFALAAAIDREDAAPAVVQGAGPCDVVIDFSSPEGTVHAAQLARDHGCALLVGTTGLSAENRHVLDEAARSIAVMIAPNTSLGVAVLMHLACMAARLLGESYDIDLVDVHHARKRDAPSGTALRIVQRLREHSGVDLARERVHCLRTGDVVGDHTISFGGPGETLRLTHSAVSRDLFARGALHAAAWLAPQPPGQYVIEDALGLPR